MNRHRLRVSGLTSARFTLFEEDNRIADLAAEQLDAGINLTDYPALSTNQRALEALKLVQQHERLLGGSWLTHVGHKRPDMPVGKPLTSAQLEALIVEQKIRALAAPSKITLKLVPVKL